jgi:hypothetical protein
LTTEPDFPPIVPGAGPLAVRTSDDVMALVPATLKHGEDAPITEALVDTLTSIVLTYQEASSYAAAQSDVGRATDPQLGALGEDRLVPQADGEDVEGYRARVVSVPATASITVLRDAANAVLARHTTKRARVFEAVLGRWFVGTTAAAAARAAAGWHSFVGATPRYPDQLYEADESINGDSLSDGDPAGAHVFFDHLGRHFHVVVPDLTLLSQHHAFLWSGTTHPRRLGMAPALDDPRGTSTVGAYLGTQVDTDQSAPLAKATATALDIYRTIEAELKRLGGQSIRWSMQADPNL